MWPSNCFSDVNRIKILNICGLCVQSIDKLEVMALWIRWHSRKMNSFFQSIDSQFSASIQKMAILRERILWQTNVVYQ